MEFSELESLLRAKFCKPVDFRSRQSMVKFLTDHPRYDTMNSCNASTSYAHNVKIPRLPRVDGLATDPYDMITMVEWQTQARHLMDIFAIDHNYEWQVGINGRSNGYLVLYVGTTEGLNGRPSIYAGKPVDQHERFLDWSMPCLRDRVRLVREFDEFVVRLVLEFFAWCRDFRMITREVPTTRIEQTLAKCS